MDRRRANRNFAPALRVAAAALFFFAFALCVSSVTAQNRRLPPPPPGPTLRPKPTPKPTPTPEPVYEVLQISSNLVVVPVSVTDANGQPVLGLKQDDFRVVEEGRPQQIAQIGDPGQVPLDIAILLDVSASVEARFGFEQKAAADFVREVLKPVDRATVFAIDETPRLIQPLATADVAARQLMTLVAAKGFTAFFDSVLAAQKYLDQNSSQGRRRVVVVISDGDDTARINDLFDAQSRNGNFRLSSMEAQLQFIERSQADVLKEVQKAEISFYSINPSGQTLHLNVRIARSEQGMERIAQATGGAAFVPKDEADLPEIFRRIASELRSQYLIQYYSNNQSSSASYRHISVTTPAQPQLRVRAREGYYPKAK